MIHRKENIPVGIGLMLLTMFFFVTLDALAKHLMQHYSVVQVIWARFFFHMIFACLALIVMQTNIREKITSKKPGLQIVRSLLMLLTNGLFFIAIQTVELTTATTIMFLSPIMITMLAIPVLGEKVGLRRWIGVFIGFFGAMVIVRPGVIEFDFAIVLLLAATVSHALYQLFTRKVRVYDDPITSLLYTGLLGTVVMSTVVPMKWQTPTLEHWPYFILLGLTGCVGHFCLITALRVAPASVVSPFAYSTLIWASGYSYFVFNEMPHHQVYIGGSIIIASGLYILHRETKLKEY